VYVSVKLLTYRDGAGSRVGALVDGESVVDLGGTFGSVLELIDGGDRSLEAARQLMRTARTVIPLRDVTLQAPIPRPRRNLLCVGWNYLSHFEEGVGRRGSQERELPEYPAFFTKPTTTVIGPYDAVAYDAAFSTLIDYEAELAVVIKGAARSIPAERALEYVFGYVVANDISARDVQRRHGGQWFKGKGMDTSCPFGPWVITADEIPDPQDLQVQCYVNGEARQSASTRHMIFPVTRLIQELSLGMTLLPGDIVLTGTPEGVGYARTPPVYLKPGDEVVTSISGIGELRNRIAEKSLALLEVFS